LSAARETAGDFHLSFCAASCKSTDLSCDTQAGDTLLIMRAVSLLESLEQHLTLLQICPIEIFPEAKEWGIILKLVEVAADVQGAGGGPEGLLPAGYAYFEGMPFTTLASPVYISECMPLCQVSSSHCTRRVVKRYSRHLPAREGM